MRHDDKEDQHRAMEGININSGLSHSLLSSPRTLLVLVKHALPVLDSVVPPRDWPLSLEGEHQSRRLAKQLAPYAPMRLVASQEPKALMTGRIVAVELGLEVSATAGLEEFDRPSWPLMPKEEHARINAPIFMDLDTSVLGTESGRRALNRFSSAIGAEVTRTNAQNLVVITHGTVIALFVAAYNDIDGFELWKQLACPSFVVLDAPSFRLREVVSPVS